MLIHALLFLTVANDRPSLPDPTTTSLEVARIAAEFPGQVRRVEYGRSLEGRPLELLRIAREPLDPDRPALLIAAGLDPHHPFGTAMALEIAERTARAAEDTAAPLLDAFTVYILPLADPDGVARSANGGPAGTGPDQDEDRDGRRGEDPPTDLDGDGLILGLRVPDASGDWILDPHDPRALLDRDELVGRVSEEPDLLELLAPDVQRYRLAPEGLDRDGDGDTGEDTAGDRRFDANFPAGWPEHAPRAGRYATGDPSVRALCDWVLSREELVLVIGLGAVDHLRGGFKAAGAATGRVPATGPMQDDLTWLEALAERGRDAMGIETGDASDHDDAGHFLRWSYDHRGLWTLGVRPWVLPTAAEETAAAEDADEAEEAKVREVAETLDVSEEPREDQPESPIGEPSDDAGRLAWIDQQDEQWRFHPWSPLEHPQLGAVELGGFTPAAHTIPPTDEWEALFEGACEFLFGLADTAPRLTIESCTAESLGTDLWRVRARALNSGWLPSSSAARERSRQGRNTTLTLELPPGAELLANPARVVLSALDGGQTQSAEWLVRTAEIGRVRVALDSANAGIDAAIPTPEENR
ncbi:MAG: M14 family zinc carboxypeptidase [Planctomycetota bacterium]|jgi:hypothetical protein